MSKTFAQLKTAIGQWLAIDQEDDAERLPDAVRGDIVNWVIKDYLRRRESRFGEFSDTFATVANQKPYTLPSNWSKPGQIWYLNPDNGGVVFLEFLASKASFDSKYPDSTVTGDPEAYTIWAQQILLGKTPKRILTLNRDYWRYLPDLSADGDTNRFTNEADTYIIFASLVKSTEFGIEDERIAVWAAEAKRLEMALDSEDARPMTTGRRSQGNYPG